MTSWRLIADVGGSNVRFAKSWNQHEVSDKRAYLLKNFQSFYAALEAFLAETGSAGDCADAAIGVAGPVDGESVKLTNADWTISSAEISGMLNGAPVMLVNDLQAVALALPHLRGSELHPFGGVQRDTASRQAMIALNVGTGFGAATIIPAVKGWITNPGEPGHMALGALDKAQLDMIRGAHSVEEMLSGRGVIKLYNHVADQLGGPHADSLSGAAIFASADRDHAAEETVRQFSALLGRIAGDLVLAAAAWGGVYLCGSVVNGWAAAGGEQYFRTPFEDKGAMSERMKSVYSGIITHDDIALIGLTYLQPESV